MNSIKSLFRAEYRVPLLVLIATLNMLVIPPDIHYAPMYVAFLVFLVKGGVSRMAVDFGREFYMFAAYVAWCLLSLAWTQEPKLVFSSLRADISTPLVALAVGVLMVRRLPVERVPEKLSVGLFAGIFLASLAAWLAAGQNWLPRYFESIGYYSTYAIVLAAAAIPYLTARSRPFYYLALAALFWFSGQRVVWLLLPLIVLGDVANNFRQIGRKTVALLVLMVVVGGVMLKFAVEQRSADAFDPKVKAASTVDSLLKNERLRAWQQWLHRANAQPVTGVGFGRDAALKVFEKTETWQESKLYHGHNILLNNYIQLGLVGLLLFLLAHLQILRWLWRRRSHPAARSAAMIIVYFLLRNMFDDFAFKRVLIVYALILGGFLSLAFYDAGRPAPEAAPKP